MCVGIHRLGGDRRIHEGKYVQLRTIALGAEEDHSFLDRYSSLYFR